MYAKKIFDFARRNNLEEVKLHVENNHVPNSVKQNIAHIAVEYGYLDILQYILEADPSILTNEECHRFPLLQQAISHGTLNVVKCLTSKRNSTVQEDEFSRTVLQRTVQFGRLDILKYFIDERKFDINWRTNERVSIVQSAINYNQLDILKYLIEEKNIDTNTCTSDGKNEPLFLLPAESGKFDIFKYVVEKTEVNSTKLNQFGKRIMANAIQKGDLDWIKYILDDKKVDIKFDHDPSPLFHAIDQGHYNIARYLIENKKINLTILGGGGQSVLYNPIKQGNLDFVKYVLENQKAEIDINHGRKDGDTLVHCAVSHSNMDVLKYLVEEKHADLNKPNRKMETPLHHASSKETCLYLIDHGAFVDSKTVNGDTPLHYSVRNCRGKFEIIACLIKHGADIDQRNKLQLTPLLEIFSKTVHYKCNFQDMPTARYLIRKGANVNLADEDGKTALHFVAEGCRFYSGDSDGSDEFGGTFRHRKYDFRMFRCLLRHGADPNLTDRHGQCPLDFVLVNLMVKEKGAERLCIYFLENGAHINRTFSGGYTFLHKAVMSNSVNLLKYLIEHGADPNQRNHDGETPLHIAEKCRSYDAFKVLIDFGADFQLKDLEGKTAVQRVQEDNSNMLFNIEKHELREYLSNKTITRKRRHLSVSFAEYESFWASYHYNQDKISGEHTGFQKCLLEDAPPPSLNAIFIGKFQSFIALLWLVISTLGFSINPALLDENRNSTL